MTIEFWHWLALGFGLLVLEMFLPTGFIFLWVGAAAVVVGALAWIVPGLGWEAEFILWGALSVAAAAFRSPAAPGSMKHSPDTSRASALSLSLSPVNL